MRHRRQRRAIQRKTASISRRFGSERPTLRRPVLLVAKLVPYYVIGLVQMSFLFGVGTLFFGMQVAGSVLALIALSGCAHAAPAPSAGPERVSAAGRLVVAAPEDVGMHPGLGVLLDSLVETGIAEGAAPGAARWCGRSSA